MHIFVHKYLLQFLITSLRCIPRNRNSGSNGVRMWRLLRNIAQAFYRKLLAIYAPTSTVRGLCLITSWQALDNTSIIIKLSLSCLSFFTETNLSSDPAVSCCKLLLHFSPSFLFSSCCPKPDSQLFYTYECAKISHSHLSASYLWT